MVSSDEDDDVDVDVVASSFDAVDVVVVVAPLDVVLSELELLPVSVVCVDDVDVVSTIQYVSVSYTHLTLPTSDLV